VPLRVDGLLVAGRSASYDSIPHGSARVVPIGMVAGEACGTAAAYAVEHDMSFRRMAADREAVGRLQEQLKKQGAYLVEYTPPRMAVMDHWAYTGVAVMRELGLTEGGYGNDYRLENELPSRWALQNKLNKLMALASARTAYRGGSQVPRWEISLDDDNVTVGEILIAAAQGASLGDESWISGQFSGAPPWPRDFGGAEDARQYLADRGILGDEVAGRFADEKATADYGQLLYLLGNLYTTLMN
jgi:hypothetical protein